MKFFFSDSRPTKRRRTDEEFTDIPAIGSFITPRAALPGGVRPVPQMSHSAMISLGSGASGSGSGGQSGSDVPQAEGPNQAQTGSASHPGVSWTEQVNGGEQRAGASEAANGVTSVSANMDESEVYPEDWVQDMDGEGDSEEQVMDESHRGNLNGTLTQQVPPAISVQAVSY
jgi:hypothetical protein